jgi:hypothetical protein
MHQTNPTEVFRERQFALLREAEDRRLAPDKNATHFFSEDSSVVGRA